ncbi:hypothetical protein [Actinoplanes sp. N902-109]|uniref:hypothetical protein n=1 Tax=Actinoplanes sp. (strain N902-109) TaxID=649831 RepID=UPI00032950BB|nr:hypothetical protein [Actinoplanes sp. N902-109]AGL19488.1 hypothetical protein L083_5978 [Actinoplanes sp. N902-109]
MSTRRKPGVFTVVKDALSYLGGWALILHQAVIVPPKDFNLTLVLLGGALVGVPGVSQLLASRIGSLPSSDPPPEESPRSPSPSPSESGAER